MKDKNFLIYWAIFFAFVIIILSWIYVGSTEHTAAPEPTVEQIETFAPTELPTETTTEPPTEELTTIPTEPPTEPYVPPVTGTTEPGDGHIVHNVPEKYNRKDFKSYMDWRTITSRTSPHYKLQNSYAYTAEDGIRMVEGRYCIALGSYFTKTIGQYVDVVLENGTVIHCILGDQKSDAHTDAAHIAHPDGSIVEFIIDKKLIDPLPGRMGSMSYAYEEWRSPVVQIIVYDINYFDIVETKDTAYVEAD